MPSLPGTHYQTRPAGTIASAAVRLFYAAPLALSLMLGKFCIANADAAAQYERGERGSIPAVQSPVDAIDRDFRAAREAVDAGNLKSFETIRARLAPRAEGHPLQPYLLYWGHLLNLAQSSSYATTRAADIQSLLDQYPDTPFADNLRREWLKALGKQDAWGLFSNAFQKFALDDMEIVCQQWRYRMTRDDREVTSEARAAWNAGRGVSEACYTVYEQNVAAGQISTADGWTRVRRLLENGQLDDARRSAHLIKNLPASFERTTAVVNLDAAKYAARERPDPKSRASIELYLFAINRLARSDAAKAAVALSRNAEVLPRPDLAYAWAQVAQYGAMQHQLDALSWYDQAVDAMPAFRFSEGQAAWRIRAALRAGDWKRVQSGIEALPASEARETAWRYWLARALHMNGNDDTARNLLTALARENNFYGLMAAEDLGIPAAPEWQSRKIAQADLDAVRGRPGIARALALYRLELKAEALREWQYAIRDMSDPLLLAAAEVAREANVPDRSINTAERTLAMHDFALRFPTPHRDSLKSSADANQLDEAWVYGLIRQESRFMADARSQVGAIGLMQLMPNTARWAAKQVGLKNFTPARAGDIPVNLSLGSFYLRHVLDDLGHPVLATAAYNAGPGRARRWRADQPLEGAIYAETIPFNETRDYVKKVMANTWYYANRFGNSKISLKSLMGTVPGKSTLSLGKSAPVAATMASMASAETH
jgi:soluble lytic murein transglycosylase